MMKKFYFILRCAASWGVALYLLLNTLNNLFSLLGWAEADRGLTPASDCLLTVLLVLSLFVLCGWIRGRSGGAPEPPPKYVKFSDRMLTVVLIAALVANVAIFLLEIRAGTTVI